MYFVYVLTSISKPEKCYIGITTNVDNRLKSHNETQDGYTKKYAPWQVETYLAFRDKVCAQSFEKYLKFGSGQAFLKRHLLPKLQTK